MKKIKYLALLLSVATFLSVVGIGFAIWYNLDVILPGDNGVITDKNNNIITAYSVDKSSSVLYCTEVIEVFEYSALAFAGNNGTGAIKATYWIDMNSEFITNSTTLTFSLTTEKNTTKGDAGLFGDVTGTTKTFSASINNSVDLGDADVSDDGKTISFTCTYDAISELVQANGGNFTLTYTLTIPETYAGGTTVGNFRKAFGQYLLSNWDSDGDGEGDTTTKFIVIAEAKLT